jgi:helicase MOV-10
MFLHHTEAESRENDSPSWMNQAEARMLANIAMKLWIDGGVPASDIALLSPYRKQVKKMDGILYSLVQRAVNDHRSPQTVPTDHRGRLVQPFRVCTVESFQGREARVVLLSCVRNQKEDSVENDVRFGIGFLKQPKRANVAMSRAQDLLVVAGNAKLLLSDPLWSMYLQRMMEMPRCVRKVSHDNLIPMTSFPPDWLRSQPPPLGAGRDTVDTVTSATEERAFERHV